MSTTIGFSSLDHIVLASDNQETEYDGDNPVSKQPVQKIKYGKHWALAFTGGGESKELNRFIGMLKGHARYGSSKEQAQAMISNAVATKVFPEFYDLNRRIALRDRTDESTYEMLFCTRKPEFGVWEVDSFGNLLSVDENHSFDYFTAGTGGEKAEKYIERVYREKALNGTPIDRDALDTGTLIQIAREAVTSAQEDLQTGFGYDLLILPKDTTHPIDYQGDEIQRTLQDAERNYIQTLVARYRPREERKD